MWGRKVRRGDAAVLQRFITCPSSLPAHDSSCPERWTFMAHCATLSSSLHRIPSFFLSFSRPERVFFGGVALDAIFFFPSALVLLLPLPDPAGMGLATDALFPGPGSAADADSGGAASLAGGTLLVKRLLTRALEGWCSSQPRHSS